MYYDVEIIVSATTRIQVQADSESEAIEKAWEEAANNIDELELEDIQLEDEGEVKDVTEHVKADYAGGSDD